MCFLLVLSVLRLSISSFVLLQYVHFNLADRPLPQPPFPFNSCIIGQSGSMPCLFECSGFVWMASPLTRWTMLVVAGLVCKGSRGFITKSVWTEYCMRGEDKSEGEGCCTRRETKHILVWQNRLTFKHFIAQQGSKVRLWDPRHHQTKGTGKVNPEARGSDRRGEGREKKLSGV